MKRFFSWIMGLFVDSIDIQEGVYKSKTGLEFQIVKKGRRYAKRTSGHERVLTNTEALALCGESEFLR